MNEPNRPRLRSRSYSWARSRILEGTFPRNVGCAAITAHRVGFGWGAPLEDEWPFEQAYWHIDPSRVDGSAKTGRLSHYFRVHDIDEVRKCIASDMSVLVAFGVTSDWFAAEGGDIPYPPTNAVSLGSHAVSVVGVSDAAGKLRFRNSWGGSWGDNGRGWVSYDYFRDYAIEAWCIEPGMSSRVQPHASGQPLLNWGVETPTGRVHGVEHYDPEGDERQAWALIAERHGFADLYEFFVRPAWRGQGRARLLAQHVLEVAGWLRRPLRVWVPEVDDRVCRDGVDATARLLGIQLSDAGVPWATRIGVRGVPPKRPPGGWDLAPLPPRARWAIVKSGS